MAVAILIETKTEIWIVGKIEVIADAAAITRIAGRGFKGSATTSRPSCCAGQGNLPNRGCSPCKPFLSM